MLFVRLLALGMFTLFCYGMSTIPTNEANGIARTFGALFFVAAPVLYMLPTIEAALRKHHNLTGVAMLNLFLGWTVFGWVGSLVWAVAKPPRAPEPQRADASFQASVEPKSEGDPSLALERLASLLERGLITREDFDAQKNRLLRS